MNVIAASPKSPPSPNTLPLQWWGVSAPFVFLALLFGIAAHARGEPAAAVLDAEARRIAVMDKAKDCVLAVFPPSGKSGGSGVVISPDGYALTNFHVVRPCGKSMKCGMADGKWYDAVLVAIDPVGDVALVKLFGRDDFPYARLADSDQVRVGQWVFAMGNPFTLATDFQPTVTYGIVSGVHRYQFPEKKKGLKGLLEYTDCLQTDASINPGNSGGPLFDDQGRLIGINGRASFEKRGRVNVGTAYAISINQIKNFLGALHSGRIIDHATLGAQIGSDTEGRAVVTDILEDSDAYRRGLRYDNEIVSFGGRPILTPNGFKNVLGIFPKGWRVPLSYRRDGKRYNVLVRLAGLHNQEELLKKVGRGSSAKPKPTPRPDGKPKKKQPPDNKKDVKPQEQLPPKPDDKPKTPSPDKKDAEPIPKPDDKPKKQPSDKKDAKPKTKPMRITNLRDLLVPKIVLEHFEKKHGFANYYFNTLNQRRVWNAWNALTNPGGAKGVWTLSGTREEEKGGEYSLQITDTGALLKLPSSEVKWTVDEVLGPSPLPAQSIGLLPALYLWRRLAVEGLGRFGDVYYYGTAPLVGREGLVDVLVGSHKGVDCRFYFDPEKGHLLAIEFFPDEDSDPCEVYFSDYRDKDGRFLPGRMEIRHGDEKFATLKIEELKVDEEDKEDEEAGGRTAN